MDIEVLIKKVFLKAEIWDKRLKSYTNRQIVDNSWQEIAEDIGHPESMIRKKWKYLRDQFCVECGKFEAQRAKGQSSDEPKWPHYKSLMFLRDVVKPRYPANFQPRIDSLEARATDSSSPAFDQITMDASEDDSKDIAEEEADVEESGQVASDDLLFFKSLLPYVSKIPSQLKLRFRNRVQDLVSEFAFNSGVLIYRIDKAALSDLPQADLSS